jgi:anti-sigma factor RsiW
MHDPVVIGLEDYLAGSATPAAAELERHLDACADCRIMVAEFSAQRPVLRVLRSGAPVEPGPGFYARIMDRIESQSANSFWSILLDPAVGRRLLFASLSLFFVLSAALFSKPDGSHEIAAVMPVAITESAPATPLSTGDPHTDRSAVLVNLATYSGQGLTELQVSSD